MVPNPEINFLYHDLASAFFAAHLSSLSVPLLSIPTELLTLPKIPHTFPCFTHVCSSYIDFGRISPNASYGHFPFILSFSIFPDFSLRLSLHCVPRASSRYFYNEIQNCTVQVSVPLQWIFSCFEGRCHESVFFQPWYLALCLPYSSHSVHVR